MNTSSSDQMKSIDMSTKIIIQPSVLPESLNLQFPKSPTDSEVHMMDLGIYSGRTTTPTIRRVADCKPQEPGLKLLEAYRSLFIKRKVKGSWFGSTMITHSVYPLAAKGDYVKGTKLFKSIEKVGWLTLSVGPHDTEVVYKSKQDPLLDNALYMTFERRDECDFFCQNRVPLRVNLVQDDEKSTMGRVIQHSDCCECQEWKFDIVDNNGDIKYVLRQESFRAKCMNIEDFGGKKLGVINYVKKSSCFAVQFPKRASGADKAMIVAAVLEISHTAYDKRWK